MSSCTYCGADYEVMDHVIPYAFTGRVSGRKRKGSSDVGHKVPACSDCNHILGATFDALTVYDRRAKVILKLRGRWSRLAGTGRWTDDELAEMGPSLRSSIVQAQLVREALEDRLEYAVSRQREAADVSLEWFEGAEPF